MKNQKWMGRNEKGHRWTDRQAVVGGVGLRHLSAPSTPPPSFSLSFPQTDRQTDKRQSEKERDRKREREWGDQIEQFCLLLVD